MKDEKTIDRQTELIILNHILQNDRVSIYNKNWKYFQNTELSQIFSSIISISNGEWNTNPLMIKNELFQNEIDISLDKIKETITHESGFDIETIKPIVDKWKEKTLGLEFINDLLIKAKKGDTRKAFELSQTEHILDRIEEIEEIETDMDVFKTPFIDDKVFNLLPVTMGKIFNKFSDKRERDVVFTSSIATLSTLFPNVKMYWMENVDRCNLYSFIAATSSSGKGQMKHSKELLHTYLLRESTVNKLTKQKIDQYNSQLTKGQEKEVFKPKHLLIPGDSSAAAFREKLEWNNGRGLIFTTEVDEIIGGKKQEWGNYDGMLRNSFHNEDISSNRKGEEITNVSFPFITTALSGTFDQLMQMFDGKSENGLFSRFIFYVFSQKVEWRGDYEDTDVFMSLTDQFIEYSKEICDIFYKFGGNELIVKMTKKQKTYFNESMEKILFKYNSALGEKICSSVKRMGVIARKMIMLFTVFREYERTLTDLMYIPNNILTVDDNDVYNSVSLVKTYMQHTSLIFNSFNYNNKQKQDTVMKIDPKLELFNKMGKSFTYKEMVEEGYKLRMNPRSIERYLQRLINNKVVEKVDRGVYNKK